MGKWNFKTIVKNAPQLWKLDGSRLLNKEGLWMSDEKWNFRTVRKNLIYIENINKTKVWGTTNKRSVTLESFGEYKYEQRWKKGEPNDEGYFTLENYEVPKFMTAISSTALELKDYKVDLICITNISE